METIIDLEKLPTVLEHFVKFNRNPTEFLEYYVTLEKTLINKLNIDLSIANFNQDTISQVIEASIRKNNVMLKKDLAATLTDCDALNKIKETTTSIQQNLADLHLSCSPDKFWSIIDQKMPAHFNQVKLYFQESVNQILTSSSRTFL